MGLLEIILLIMGAALFVAGYVFPEKKEKLNEDQQKMVKDEVARLTGEEMAQAKKELSDAIEESVGFAMEKSERSLERISNEKVMAVSEYADSVLTDIKKNHDEVVFMYDMLSGKHDDLKETVKEVDKTSREAREMALDARATAEEVKEAVQEVKEEVLEEVREEPAKIVEFKPMPQAARKRGDNSTGMELLRSLSQTVEQPAAEEKPAKETEETEKSTNTEESEAAAEEAEEKTEETEEAAAETEEQGAEEEAREEPKRGRGRPKSNKNAAQGAGQVQDISALLLGGGKKPRNMEGKKPSNKPNPLPKERVTASDSIPEEGIQENSNARILALHEKGKSPVNIARELGLGVGEVQLVIGLYQGRN